jgi:effector-binding domain-containing protein
MPVYHVERSVRIDANESQVRPAIQDFGEWPKWSPWLCMEPTAKVNVFGTPGQTDHGYDWDGELVGAGSMKIASVAAGRQAMDLAFTRPFKSKAKVLFEIKPLGDSQTEVTWHMDGKMPFFLFFMIGTMKALIGMDYARGLKMLKEYVETGAVHSKVEIVGVVDVSQTHYLGVEARCAMDEIGDSMRQTMPAAHTCATENQMEIQGPPGALYHNVDLKQQQCHYTAIVQTKSLAEIDGVTTGTIGPCRALKIIHRGNYQHLGNAWSTAMAYQRSKKLKPLKSQCAFELYPNDPGDTPEEDWITEIFVPVRSSASSRA